jgi:hypothetical protein
MIKKLRDKHKIYYFNFWRMIPKTEEVVIQIKNTNTHKFDIKRIARYRTTVTAIATKMLRASPLPSNIFDTTYI